MAETDLNPFLFGEGERERFRAEARANVMHRPTGDLNSYDDVATAWMLDVPWGSLATKITALWEHGGPEAIGDHYSYIADANPWGAFSRDFDEPMQIPEYNVYRDEDLSGYEQYYHDFMSADSPAEARAIKQMIDTQTQRRIELDQNGAFWTRLMANVLDPINLVPIPLARGMGFVKGFTRGGVSVGALMAPGEIMRGEIDPTTTPLETVVNIGAGTFFGGSLGGLAGKMSPVDIETAAMRWWEGNDTVDAMNRIADDDADALAGIRPMEDPSIVVVRDDVAVSDVAAPTDVTTTTPAFADWFSGSKVVDNRGQPLVVYHGSRADIEQFDPNIQRAEYSDATGIYFTSRPDSAENYAMFAGVTGKPTTAAGDVIYPVYLNMKNPYVIKEVGWWARFKEERKKLKFTETEAHKRTQETALITDARRKELEAQGYDGIINKQADEFIVFSPDQIRFSTKARGETPKGPPLVLPTRTVPRSEMDMGGRGAFYRDADEAGERVNTIFLDDAKLREDFENKAWTDPKVEGVAPLPADRFKTFEEWREFVVRHETAHAYFRRHANESLGAYEQRMNRIADDVDKFNDYVNVARSYNPNRLVPTGLAENIRWEQHPFFLMLNNKFSGFTGNEFAAVANEFVGAAGLMNKGNQAETATRQSIFIQAKQHNKVLVEARAELWKSYKESQGLDPSKIVATPGAQALDSLKELVSGGAKRYNEYTHLVTKHYLDGTPPPTDAIKNGVSAMAKYYDEMGRRAKEVGAFNTKRLESNIAFKNELIAKHEAAIERMEKVLADIQKSDRMTKRQLEARDNLANNALPERRARLENIRNQRDGMEAALKDPDNMPQLDPSAAGHFHRIWKRGVVEENRDVLEGILARHFDSGATKMERVKDTIDNILKVGKIGRVARELAMQMERAGAPIEAIERVSKRITKISKMRRDGKRLTDAEQLEEASIIVNRTVKEYGLGDGTAKAVNEVMEEIMELSSHPGAEIFGSAPGLLSRRLGLPSHLFVDVPELKGGSFIETDPETVMRIYHRRMSVAIESQRRYGDVSMQSRIDELWELAERDIQRAVDDGDIEMAVNLEGERKIQIQAATDLRDKVLGVYGIPSDPSAIGVRAIQFTKNWMVMALMGKATVAALADMGRMAMAVGAKSIFEGVGAKWTVAADDFVKGGKEVELAGEAAEVALHGRFEAIMDLEQYYTGVSTVEKYAEKGTNAMFLLNMLAPYTDVMKRFSGAIIQSQMIESTLIWSGKKSGRLTKRQRETLLRLGIDRDMAQSISRQWELSGQLGPGRGTNKLFLANTDEWTDVEAQRVFRNALAEEVNNAVITQGPADKLNFMSTPMGSLITQFKSFSFAATNRTMLAGIQQRDAQALHGIMAMIALGYLVDSIRSGPFDDRSLLSTDRFVQAVDYSGVFGILFELNNMIEMTSGVALDQPIGIRPLLGIDPAFGDATAARAIGQTGGPSIGLFANLTNAFLSEEGDASDQVRAVRRLIPFNQLIWWSWAVSRLQRDAISLAED